MVSLCMHTDNFNWAGETDRSGAGESERKYTSVAHEKL